jgi:hypothetical protein
MITPYTFFTGVVEDILDPEEMGRVRVRVFGFHSPSRQDIPTSSLPWATPLLPTTSASMSGVGTSGTGLLPGSWVVGFFRDGESGQDPLILGSIPSISSRRDPSLGFSDPSGVNPRHPGEVDTPRSARSSFRDHPAYTGKLDTRVTSIPTAVPPSIPSVAVPEPAAYYARKTWDSPDPADTTRPIYPFNSVEESSGGHVEEVDDTPGYERISTTHRSGAFRQFLSDGSEVLSIRGKRFVIISKDDNVYIRGSCNITVDGDCRHLVKGNLHVEVEGNYTENIKGSKQVKVGHSHSMEIGQDWGLNIGEGSLLRVGKDVSEMVIGSQSTNIGKDYDFIVSGTLSDFVLGNRSFITGGNLTGAVGGVTGLALVGAATIKGAGISITATDFGVNATGALSLTGNDITQTAINSFSSDAASLSLTSTGTPLSLVGPSTSTSIP